MTNTPGRLWVAEAEHGFAYAPVRTALKRARLVPSVGAPNKTPIFFPFRRPCGVEEQRRQMKHDRQFSIPGPESSDGKQSRIFIDCFGGGDYVIEVRGKDVRFEWSERFGPMPINKDGSEALSIGPRHAFWRIVSLWNLQGRRIENGKCIWHEPKKPVLRHLGGRNYMVVADGEPGHDW